MAVTVTTLQVATSGWAYNAASDDWTGCEEIVAAPGDGKHLCLTSVTFASTSDTSPNLTLGAGETTGSVTATLLGPIGVTASTPVTIVFSPPIQVTANTALVADGGAAQQGTIVVQGYTA